MSDHLPHTSIAASKKLIGSRMLFIEERQDDAERMRNGIADRLPDVGLRFWQLDTSSRDSQPAW